MTLLSGVGTGLGPAAALVMTEAATPPQTLHLALNGSAQGFYVSRSFPDAGTLYGVAANGHLTPVGATKIRGSLHSLGFIANGHATGTLDLQTANGVIHVKLVGPLQKGFSPLPTTFAFSIAGGTGRYLHATGTGTVTIALKAASNPGGPAGTGHGTVAMVFHSTTPTA
jgi:hypothetical protein